MQQVVIAEIFTANDGSIDMFGASLGSKALVFANGSNIGTDKLSSVVLLFQVRRFILKLASRH